jgi:hypothetical protein
LFAGGALLVSAGPTWIVRLAAAQHTGTLEAELKECVAAA